MWSLLILLTTANFPDVMIPGYASNKMTMLFFCSFVIIGAFVLLNILLGIVVDVYLAEKEAQANYLADKRACNLMAAFELIQVE
jgi:hypothetical protein